MAELRERKVLKQVIAKLKAKTLSSKKPANDYQMRLGKKGMENVYRFGGL